MILFLPLLGCGVKKMKRFEQSIVLDEMYNSKINKKSAIFDPLSLLKIDRKIVTYTTAITLPLILAACGGGGGGVQ